MAEIFIKIQNWGDGFFYFFGFIENPAKSAAYKTIEDSPSDKIKGDLKRLNKDYRKTFVSFKQQMKELEPTQP